MPRLPRVFVSLRLPGRGLERLARVAAVEIWPGPGSPPPEVLANALRNAEGLLCSLGDRVDGALLAAAPGLRVISSCSVGLDHVDLPAATARGIPVGFTPRVLARTTAELAFALMLAAARRVVEADAFVRAGRWTPDLGWDPELLLGRDLGGAVLGVVGLGAIGRTVAALGRGFGMRVLGWSRSAPALHDVEAVSLPALLEAADFVSIHVALAPETRGLIDAVAIARMRPGAILVNTARGGIVDETALARALQEGRLAAAALDVFGNEPLDPSSPLLAAPNLVLTPHIGSASKATRIRMADLAVDNLIAGLEGRPLPECANAPAL